MTGNAYLGNRFLISSNVRRYMAILVRRDFLGVRRAASCIFFRWFACTETLSNCENHWISLSRFGRQKLGRAIPLPWEFSPSKRLIDASDVASKVRWSHTGWDRQKLPNEPISASVTGPEGSSSGSASVQGNVQGGWQRDRLAGAGRLQALERVQRLEHLPGEVRLVAADLLQRIPCGDRPALPEALLIDPNTAAEVPGLRLQFAASDVYIVMGGHGTVRALVNGKPTRTIRVDAQRLYTVRSAKPTEGLLELRFSPGVQAYSFTFG